MTKLVKCNKCKWVHFEIELDESESPVINCFRCGNDYKDFQDAQDGDVPDGSTVQPILKRDG